MPLESCRFKGVFLLLNTEGGHLFFIKFANSFFNASFAFLFLNKIINE
jgi:hypothetical protein